ncbi:hypothetical protein D3C76_1236380 [compost metagenome]
MQLVGCDGAALEDIAKHSCERDSKRRRKHYPGNEKNRDTSSPQRRPLKTNPKQRQAQFEDEPPPRLPGGESAHEQHD